MQVTGSFSEDQIISKHHYAWISRHPYVKRLMLAVTIALMIGFFRVVVQDIPFSKTRPEVVVYMLAGAFLIGYLCDFFLKIPSLFNDVLLKREGLEVLIPNDGKQCIAWEKVKVVDEFDVREKRISQRQGKKSDWLDACGTGGLRITVDDGQVIRIFRSIRSYKTLKKVLIDMCPNAEFLENGMKKH